MTKFPKYLVGLTGSIASGKSTVLKELARLGACTLSADELVRELYQTAQVRGQLEKWFGSAEPQEVATAVFKSETARKKVEDFLHPLVWQLAQAKLALCSKPWAVFEVPLLFEAGWEQKMDLIVLVTAGEQTLATRLEARGISPDVYRTRRQTQLSETEKIGRADITIFNDTTPQALHKKAGYLYNTLKNLYEK